MQLNSFFDSVFLISLQSKDQSADNFRDDQFFLIGNLGKKIDYTQSPTIMNKFRTTDYPLISALYPLPRPITYIYESQSITRRQGPLPRSSE